MSGLRQIRRAVSLRISVTDRCPLSCVYCRPSGKEESKRGLAPFSSTRAEILSFEEIVRLVRAIKSCFDLSGIRITGGEPLVRRGLVRLVAMLSKEGVPDLSLTTNGQLLAESASSLRGAGLRRVNISLDSLDRRTYHAITGGGDLERTLSGIDAVLQCGLTPVKSNMVVLRNINDHEIVRMARFGLERGIHVRFLEVMPIGAAAARFDEWFVSSADVVRELETAFDLHALPLVPGATSRDFLVCDGEGRRGVIGLISPESVPFCGSCRRLRLTAGGRLLGCLARVDGVDVGPMLGRRAPVLRAQLADAVEKTLALKQYPQRFVDQRLMVSIGG